MRAEFRFAALQADDMSADSLSCRSVVVSGHAGLVPVDDLPDIVQLGLPTHHDGAVYGYVRPLVLDGTTVDLST